MSLDDHYPQQKLKPSGLKGQESKPVKDVTQSEVDELKSFDLDYAYGPAYGISRLERWQRAKTLGLNPPERVKQLIECHPSDTAYAESLWHDTVLTNHES